MALARFFSRTEMNNLFVSKELGLGLIASVLVLTRLRSWMLTPANQKKRDLSAAPPNEADPSKEKLDAIFNKLQDNFEHNVTSKIWDEGRWDYAHRMQQLYGLRDMIIENRDLLYQAASSDIGRTKGEFVIEVGATLAELDMLIGNLREWMKPESRGTPLWMAPSSSVIIREPLGVCLVLGTWNYGSLTCIIPLAGAICAGNAAILKPSEVVPAQSSVLAKLLVKYVDRNMLQVVEGGPKTAQTLVDSYNWGKVFYTGGGKIGAQIGASCAARHVPVCLELGGKSPTVILDDANLTVTCRRIAQGKFVNAGQTCIAPDFIIAIGDEKRHKEVTDALTAEVAKQYPGDVSKYSEYARIVNSRHYERVMSLLKSGGKVIYGGKFSASENFIEPTLVVDCPWESAIMQEEIFGPLLPIVYAKTMDEAIRIIRARPKALCVYVFGHSSKKINYILSRTSSGSACVNEAVFQYLNSHLPFGGIGASGVGAHHGHSSFLEFSHSKSVMIRNTMGDIYLRYLPYLKEEWVQSLFGVLLAL